MGIDVTSSKVVTYNAGHERLVNTGTKNNPTIYRLSFCSVVCVFQRRKSKDVPGDGNPLIYALKGKHGYQITIHEIAKFLSNFYAILCASLANKSFDIVVPLPSAYAVTGVLAKRVSRHLNGAQILDRLIEKRTVGEVLAELINDPPAIDSIHRRELGALKASLKKQPAKGRLFSMKDVDVKIRAYINPLKIVPSEAIKTTEPLRILLVDDLLATGSTMNAAAALLQHRYPSSHIEGLCLLSKL